MVSISGNIFADLGLADADERLFKADLVARIHQVIVAQGWTQTHAAEVIGVPQPHLSNLLRGRFDGFSVERLFTILNKLGWQVEVRLVPNQEQARMVVV